MCSIFRENGPGNFYWNTSNVALTIPRRKTQFLTMDLQNVPRLVSVPIGKLSHYKKKLKLACIAWYCLAWLRHRDVHENGRSEIFDQVTRRYETLGWGTQLLGLFSDSQLPGYPIHCFYSLNFLGISSSWETAWFKGWFVTHQFSS